MQKNDCRPAAAGAVNKKRLGHKWSPYRDSNASSLVRSLASVAIPTSGCRWSSAGASRWSHTRCGWW